MRAFLVGLVAIILVFGFSQYQDNQDVDNINSSNPTNVVEVGAATTSKTITAATFNVLKPTDKSYGSWDSRKKVIANTIKAPKADVVGLNEMYESYQVKGLASLTGYKIIKPIGTQPYGWTNAIAYNPNTTKVLKQGAYFFKNQRLYTRTDYKNGDIPSRLIGKYASRTAVWSLMQTGGKKYIFISTQTQVDRHGNINELQIAEIVKLARQLGYKYGTKNIIYSGDFNEDNYVNNKCSPQVPTYIGTRATLDYVCSNSKVSSVKTINSRESDHYLLYGKTVLY